MACNKHPVSIKNLRLRVKAMLCIFQIRTKKSLWNQHARKVHKHSNTKLCNSTCSTFLKQFSNLPSFVWPKFTSYVMVMVKCHLLSLHFYPCTDTRYARLLDKVLTLFLGQNIPLRGFFFSFFMVEQPVVSTPYLLPLQM